MAVIPPFQTSPGAVGNTTSTMPRPQRVGIDIPQVQHASGDAAIAVSISNAAGFGQAARAGDKLAAFGNEFAEKYAQAKMEIDAADQTADLSKKLTQVQFDASKIPDRDAATKAYDDGAAKIWDDYSVSGAHPLVKAHVTTRFDHEATIRRADTQNAAFQLWGQTERGKLVDQLDQFSVSASQTLNPELQKQQIALGLDMIDGRVNGGALNPEAAAKMKIDFKSNVYRTSIEIMAAKNPELGLKLYDASKSELVNPDDARKMAIWAEDKRNDVNADAWVNKNLAVPGGGLDNNIGNITASGASYSGGKGATVKAPSGLTFETFATPEHGVAASYNLIQTKAQQNGGSISFTELIKGNNKVGGWDKNAPDTYAATLANSVGLKPGDAVPVGDTDKMATVLKTMNRFEKGKQTVPDEAFARGVKVGQGDKSVIADAGDSVLNYAIQAGQLKQQIIADTSISEPERSRRLAKIDQRVSSTVGLAASQRKQAADFAEQAGTALVRGSLKPGTLQMITDAYRQSGDNGAADAWQFYADHESVVQDWMSLPKSDIRALASMVGGKGADVLRGALGEMTEEQKQSRADAVIAHKSFTDASKAGADPVLLAATAQEAASKYLAAGDARKARSIITEFNDTVAAHNMTDQIPSKAAADINELRKQVESQGGLDASNSRRLALATQLQDKKAELWQKDPITAATKPGELDPYVPGMSGQALALWANKRAGQAETASAKAGKPVPMYTASEAADYGERLKAATVDHRQQALARDAAAIPANQIGQFADQISKGGTADAWGAALFFYKKGDIINGNKMVQGGNSVFEGGSEGREKIKLDVQTVQMINDEIGKARAGMEWRTDGRVVERQNNAIISMYAAERGALAAGDGGKADSETLKKAIYAVVGRPMSKNEGTFLLPAGVDSYQFDAGLQSMTEADLPQNLARAANGQQVTLGMIKGQATFQSVGDGVYNVWMKDPRADHLVPLRTTDGKYYELNIVPLVARGAGMPRDTVPGMMPGYGSGYVSPEAIAAGAKPTIEQKSGDISTEKTIGVEIGGKHYVLPTIVNGKSLTEDAAVAAFRAGKNKPLGVFDTEKEATAFAEDRSRRLDKAFGGKGELKKGPSNPASGNLSGGEP